MTKGQHRSSTKRDFVQAAAALLTSFVASRALAQKQMASTSESVSSLAGDAAGESTNMKTKANAERMTTEVFVNGKGPYNFIVDTGAERSVLSDRVVAELGLTPSGRASVQGLILKIQADLVTIDSLAYGTFIRKHLVVPVLSGKLLDADGCLGLDIISGTRIKFDFAGQMIRIDRSGIPPNVDGALGTVVVIRGTGHGGRLRSNLCTVDGVRATAFVDTGSESTIGNLALLNALSSEAHPDLGAVTLQGATGGEAKGRLIRVGLIQLEGLLFQRGLVVFSDVPDFDEWGIYTKPAILIGMDFLRKFVSVSIDYRREEIRFELAAAAAQILG